MLDLRGSWAEMVRELHRFFDTHLGPAALVEERKAFVDDFGRVLSFGCALNNGGRVVVSLRNWFAAGDLVWHVDRSARGGALRLLWPLNRKAGMYVTTQDNIDPELYRAYMSREHPLLCRLDRALFDSGESLERLWRHRPRQVQAMRSGIYPFLRQHSHVWQLDPHAIGVHRFETPTTGGTYHRSTWENRDSPGLQVIMTSSY